MLSLFQPSDLVYFSAYALAGLVPSLSSSLVLLEHYGLQLQHLSLHSITLVVIFVRNRTLTLIEREDDTRSWRNFLVYFSHSTTISCLPRGWRYILIGC